MKLLLSLLFLGFLFSGNIYGQETPVKSEKEVFTCPMHPEIREEKAGKCPKCEMNLVPEKKNTEKTESAEEEDDSDEDHCSKCKEKKAEKKKADKCDKCKEKMSQDDTDEQEEKTVKKEEPIKKATYYTCSMHPEIKKNKPGKCPKCGMKLILHKDKKSKKKKK